MIKRKYAYILYYFQITLIGIFILVICVHNVDVKQKDFFARSMYTENVKGLQLSNDYLVINYGENVDFKIPQTDLGDFMIYKRLSDEYNEIVRAVYATKDVFRYSEYIADGRFFDDKDYENKTMTAVIGASMIENTYSENGKKYVGYENQLFEIIGVFEETGTNLDHTVYLNLTCYLQYASHHGLYYIDAKEKNIVEGVIREIQEGAENKYSASEVVYTPQNTYGLNGVNNILLLCVIFSATLNLFVMSECFVIGKQYMIAVQKLCGMTRKDLYLFVGKKVTMLIVFSYISIIIIMYFVTNKLRFFNMIKTLSWQHYIITAIILMILGVYVTKCVVRQSEQVDISNVLKGR
ncbi:MAG: ABC transporter permease [Lachnospiraceae bacterium]|nr:ABC transporter permease [Lachnospiraceae bacterium]